ncbi:MAG: pyridoxal-phosphate dependent enzyme [Gemmatimonadetes bacterium]|nr:pyridoxal-phosphate dependent enzyme [Gemmatimonadota bacterium]
MATGTTVQHWITLEEIFAARERVRPFVRHTPVSPLSRDSGEVGHEKLFLKLDNLQVTGAYKPRAAFAVMTSLTPDERARGVVLTSSGNFAQAFAYAGAVLRIPVIVVMMDRASPYKVNATRGYGAEVVFCGNDALARQPTVERVARERGMTAIDSWEDARVATGHASLGLEILEDFPEVQTILVPVSSGGVAAGVATAVKLTRPEIRVIGVQPEHANAAYVSLRRGEPTTIDYWDSIADGLSAVRPGHFPFRHIQRYLDDIVLITEQDIANTFRTLLFRAKILAEPAGVVASAAFLAGKADNGHATVACVTGGNVTEQVVRTLLDRSAD